MLPIALIRTWGFGFRPTQPCGQGQKSKTAKVQNRSLVRPPNSASCRKLFHNLKRVEARLVAAGEVPPERLVAQTAIDLGVTPSSLSNAAIRGLHRNLGRQDCYPDDGMLVRR